MFINTTACCVGHAVLPDTAFCHLWSVVCTSMCNVNWPFFLVFHNVFLMHTFCALHLWKMLYMSSVWYLCAFFSASLFLFCFCRWLLPRMWRGREKEGTKTLTTCSSCWSSATAAWAKPPSCSATLTMLSPRPSSAQWASTSKWRLCTRMTRGSNCRSGYEICINIEAWDI